jgi:hypothetical protein
LHQESTPIITKIYCLRKRKIFYANGTAKELVKILEDNSSEKFLLPCSIEFSVNPLFVIKRKENQL